MVYGLASLAGVCGVGGMMGLALWGDRGGTDLIGRQTKKHGDKAAADPSARARELFARWAAEEEAGYEGEVSWEEFKEALDAERCSPEYRKLFPDSGPS